MPSYPETVDEPRIYANSFSSNAFMFYSVTPLPGNPRQQDLSLSLDFIEDTVKPRLAGVAGISEVGVYGGVERQVQILVDPIRLAQRGLSLPDLREAVRSRNRDRSGGMIDAGKRQYLLRTVGRFEDLGAAAGFVGGVVGSRLTCSAGYGLNQYARCSGHDLRSDRRRTAGVLASSSAMSFLVSSRARRSSREPPKPCPAAHFSRAGGSTTTRAAL